jgi:hypothetical protein
MCRADFDGFVVYLAWSISQAGTVNRDAQMRSLDNLDSSVDIS